MPIRVPFLFLWRWPTPLASLIWEPAVGCGCGTTSEARPYRGGLPGRCWHDSALSHSEPPSSRGCRSHTCPASFYLSCRASRAICRLRARLCRPRLLVVRRPRTEDRRSDGAGALGLLD
ncbi:hypothetical protein B0H14DRAFT_348150 [Mycena olivaceomarginata]|nr:hypothetical protein B0H14DRAFT_348150 [Mycena olivaceomarginata]